MQDKLVTFTEALFAKKLGFKIYGITDNGIVKDWNPENQNMVSWHAIEKGKWYIKNNELLSSKYSKYEFIDMSK